MVLGIKGIGKVQKDYHSFNREAYHMQLTPVQDLKKFRAYGFNIQIHPLAIGKYTLVFELFHTNVH